MYLFGLLRSSKKKDTDNLMSVSCDALFIKILNDLKMHNEERVKTHVMPGTVPGCLQSSMSRGFAQELGGKTGTELRFLGLLSPQRQGSL